MRRSFGIFLGAAVLSSTLTAASAAVPIDDISTAARVTARAVSLRVATDVVSVVNKANALQPDVQSSAISATLAAQGAFALGRGASLGMTRVMRGAAPVQLAPSGYQFPMSTTVLPLDAVGAVFGRDIAAVIATGAIVMGKRTADLRGAQAGDTVDLVSASGGIVTFAIGLVADDARVGGAELLIDDHQADALGVTTETRLLAWGFSSREAIDAQLAASGLLSRADVRVNRSWDPPSPDSTLGLGQTKVLLGEFAYRILSNGTDLAVTPEWAAASLPPDREVIYSGIPIRARCHNAIKADLAAALAEVAAAGLSGAIDVGNANTYGGCYYPRFNRISGALGFLSRHSWGQALDTNTTTNAQGNRPQMNCDVVRIFRKNNFAWGGNFLTPDGMHFEWVGARRDLLQYPSKYCPNIVNAPATETAPDGRPVATAPATTDGWDTFFADDGWVGNSWSVD